jgi:hypothetical protein
MAQELRREWRLYVAANTLVATPQRSRTRPAYMASVAGKEEVIVMPRVKRTLPVFGSLLDVMQSMPFGCFWYAAPSRVTMIGPYVWSLEAWPDGQSDMASGDGKQAASATSSHQAGRRLRLT